MLQRQNNRNSSAFCVMLLDLDRFKSVNDNLGHSIGDELLINVGKRLENTIRCDEGDVVARLGGDEYAILLTGVTAPADAIRFAERIKETLSQPFKLDGQQVFTAASIGIVMNNHKYEQPEEVLRDADIAMYRAKENKTGCEIFKLEMGLQASSILETERGLRDALENNELKAFYQPIVALRSGKLLGFEALMRWEHPTRGLVSPADFIPVAEQTGLIIPMTLWIMREACSQLAKWQMQSLDYRHLLVSVNLSSQHFAEPDLVEQVRDVLLATKLEPHHLKLEITESAVMENAEETIRAMEKLRSLGVRLSIDDFGTGYSSLSYLHQFPIDTLKVDRSFVSRIGKNGENSQIVRAIMALAQSLELEVIAEGIETVEQLETLRNLGCRYAQGYLMSKPLPQANMDKLLEYKTNWLPEDTEIKETSSANMYFLPEKAKSEHITTVIINSDSDLTN
jgi:diguanylate cyclase (GGDEF)-like protein